MGKTFGNTFGSALNTHGALLNQTLPAPTSLVARTYSDTRIDLSWTINATDQDGHRIYMSTDNVTFIEKGTVSGTAATYQATGLTADTTYYFKVVAYKSDVESDASNIDYRHTIIGLNNWLAALRDLDSNNAVYDINCHGDSITEGYSAALDVSIFTLGYVGQLRSYFANKYADVGTGLIPSYAPYDFPFFSYAGTWVDYIYGFNRLGKRSTTANSTITIPFNGTGLSLVMITGSNASFTGAFTVAIDGWAEQNFTSYNAALAFAQRKIDVASGLADGDHTAVVKLTGASMCFAGAYIQKGVKGVRVNGLGLRGTTSYQGGWDEYNGGSSTAGATISPKLTIIAYITNDIGSGTVLSAFTTSLQALITEAKTTGDVVILCNTTRMDKTEAQQIDYVNALIALGVTNGCHVINTYEAWGAPDTTPEYMFDDIHPSLAGHTDLKNRLVNLLVDNRI